MPHPSDAWLLGLRFRALHCIFDDDSMLVLVSERSGGQPGEPIAFHRMTDVPHL